ncbi:MAG: adenine phosphoribosyltransferase [Candidatus Marinimicrobia bacterium]|nr:adenine phosphoribosyltransferase [Candidatus Neomarinimicrobiota bacterium]MCF7830060.1 adenine phosphoribosyltransferase [Candidatus Neomarinimicrobiota bacterium]MCF7882361.1 adenine phosphoribosyltransferase [Candidatus Neomarinimicrobiota bacterium]
MNVEDLKQHIRNIPDFPRPGIMFRDISTLLLEPEAVKTVLDALEDHFKDLDATKIAGIESRGFIFAAALADRMNLGLVLIRKSGKLPGDVHEESYDLEYGTDTLELHKDAIGESDNVILIDDLLATSGTMSAAVRLIEDAGGAVGGIGVVVELDALGGREALDDYNLYSLIHY